MSVLAVSARSVTAPARRGARAMLDTLAPLAVTVAIVTFLADPSHIDVGELRANPLLIGARPLFRVIAPGDELRVSLGNSALLFIPAVVGAGLVGVLSGLAYSWSHNGLLRAVAWSGATLASSLPAFFWAVALDLVLVALYVRFGVRPLPMAGFGVDEHLVLPTLALAIRPAAYIFRLTATAVEDIRHTDYVRTARAKGVSEKQLLARHVLPNAAPHIIGAVVLGARGVLSSLLIVEFVYVWGGAGTLFVQVLAQRRLVIAAELALAFAIVSALLGIAADAARRRVGRTS